jgi:hypothetical protein
MANSLHDMVKQPMLYSRCAVTKADFVGQFLDSKAEQGNEFTSYGHTKVKIITIVVKGSIPVWNACPNKFLEHSPATCDMAEGSELMVSLGA